jgi:hypothetical protein
MAEPLPALKVSASKTSDGKLEVHCGYCSWHRTFGTKHGATTRLAEHVRRAHRICLTVPGMKGGTDE